MNDKYVSIIIPTLNEEEYLPLCLESIYSLDYPKKLMEIIVVDNGSTDRTREIAKEYGANVLIDYEMNVSGLRNLGASKSKGIILAFVDADCIVSKDWLSASLIYFDKNDVAAWGSPPVVPVDATWVQKTWYLIRKKNKIIEKADWLESMNLFVRKSTFDKIGGFNDSLVTCEDVDFSYRIKQYGNIVSDSTMQVTHLGEAKTVREFFNKELWRGRSNIVGIFSHGITLKEIPSLSIPLYFGVYIPFLYVMLYITSNLLWLALGVFSYILPFIYIIYKKREKMNIVAMIKLVYLLNIYFFARTISILRVN